MADTESQAGSDGELRIALREALVFWGVAALVVVLLVAVRTAASVLLLTFAGLLFGNVLRASAEWVARRMNTSISAGVAVCLIAILVAGTIAWVLLAPRVADQVPKLSATLVQGVEHVRADLEHSDVGRQALAAAAVAWKWLHSKVGVALEVVSGLTAGAGALLYIAFVAVYYAFSPGIYCRGVLALVPPSRRERASEIFSALGITLRRWVWARLVSMTVLGLATTVALRLLGIPLATTLGLLAGMLMFIPYLGSLASAIPALLIAATIDFAHVVYVAIVYIGIHLADGYLLDPALQKRAVRIPPLLLLGGQLVAGELWGILGLVIATPMIAATMVMVRMIYVEDILHGEG